MPEGIVPSVPSAGVMVNGLPLQIVFENEFTEAEGFTVMITVNEFPVPQAVVGVTV